jgi:hypothetical protein
LLARFALGLLDFGLLDLGLLDFALAALLGLSS